jgi:Mg2+ and Co2+ transporter CorA
MLLLLLFVTFEAILWGVGVSIVPALAGVVGAWAILVANLASAAAMFAFLLRRHPQAMASLRRAWNE